MGLEVWFELAGCHYQSKCELLHWWVPFFCTTKCLASIVHRLLDLVFFPD